MGTRKYISEFGLNMQAVRVLILQQRHLETLTDEHFLPGRSCHIYAIGRRPRITFEPDSFVITPQAVRAAFKVHRRDKPQVFDFEVQNNSNPVVRCECEYPYTEFSFRDAEGKSVIDGPVVHYLAMTGMNEVVPEAFDLEILYVGQAFGKDGARTAPQRLGSHETLQKIYSEAIYRSPEMEIWIVLFCFRQWILASFDGRTDQYGTTEEEDTAHMARVAHTEITEGQWINYTEAAMIRYFQPQYNIEFKNSFPDQKHTSYSECYNLDLNAVAVEIDSREIGCRSWSPAVEPDWDHLISFALHSPEERQHMFDMSPGAFPRKSAEGQADGG